MKTSNLLHQNSQLALGFITMASILFSMASCKKEELQQPATDDSSSTNMRTNHLVSPNIPMSFAFISINHITMSSAKADYKVTVSANGMVTYEGRKNVYTQRTVTFKATEIQLKTINNLYLQFTSANTTNLRLNGHDGLPVMDYVETTYSSSDKIFHTLYDFDNGVPVKLISFRSNIEQILNIARFTNFFGPLPDPNTGKLVNSNL